MPVFTRGDVSLNYQEFGSGYPLLLFAPGGMRSSIDFWHRSPFDPTAEFAANFRVIAMDQRNAGQSRAPLSASDGWQTYTADHIALLDHLGIERCHIMGGCIGSSYCLGLIQAAPQRVSAAVLQNPIGLSENNRNAFYNMFDEWAAELAQSCPETDQQAARAFRGNMFDGEFVFSVTRDFVRTVQTPLLVLAGNDDFHPTPIAREIVDLAPHAELIMEWRTPEVKEATVQRVRAFLEAHTPTPVSV